MVIDVLTTMAVAGAIVLGLEALEYGIGWLISLWGKKPQQMPETLQAELGETDREMIRKTQELMRQVYGEDIVKRYAEANTRERINLTYEFAEQLAKLYGVDVNIDMYIEEPKKNKPYTFGKIGGNTIILNMYLIDIGERHEDFEDVIKEIIDTIIHEMRHAVQKKAIEQPGFWDMDDIRRATWARNLENYIPLRVDFQMYMRQPLETDARTFAAEAMKGMV